MKREAPDFVKEDSKKTIVLKEISRNCLSDLNGICKSKAKTVLVGQGIVIY
jgi:hypothetical protein